VIDNLNGEIIPYHESGRFHDSGKIDRVFHFASPTDKYDFEDLEKVASTMVDYSMSVLNKALEYNAKFIFASSQAAQDPVDEYGVYKRFFEQYIMSKTDNYLIYRIPRVYDKTRNKGLMKQLRLGDVPEEHMDTEVEYIELYDFQHWFLRKLGGTGLVKYHGPYTRSTIKEIKEKYI
jgi:dTDP-4-dehydrorhamnose reductase